MRSIFAAAFAAVLLLVCLPAGAIPITFGGSPPPAVTYAALPTCNSAMLGARRVVTNANTQTAGEAITGTGAYRSLGECDGAGAWRIPGGGGGGGGGGGDLTGIESTDNSITIGSPGGPVPNITLPATVMRNDTGNSMALGSGIDFSVGYITMPAGITCLLTAGQFCIDTNGIINVMTNAMIQQRIASTDYYVPLWTSLGTGGTRRLLGIGVSNGSTVFTLANTSTASSVVQADSGGKINDNWLSSLVSLLGQTIESSEITDGTIARADTAITGTPNGSKYLRDDWSWQSVTAATLPAQSSAPSDPSAGNFVLWFDTDDSQVKVIDSSSNDYVLARRQATDPTTNACMRFSNSQMEEAPGCTIDNSGVMAVSGLATGSSGMGFTATDAITNCTTTYGATNGGIFYDDSEAKFKKCQDGVLTDLDGVQHLDINLSSATVNDDRYFKISGGPATLLGLDCVATGGTTPNAFIVRIDECTSSAASCADTGGQVTLSALTTNTADTTFTDASVADDAWIRFNVVSLTTAPDIASCRLEFAQ